VHREGLKVRSQTWHLIATPEDHAVACRLGHRVQILVSGQASRRPLTNIPFSSRRCSSIFARRVRLIQADWRDLKAPQYGRNGHPGPRASTPFFGIPPGLLLAQDAQQVQERAAQEMP